MADGFLLIDKPAGPTSHDVVSRTRRAFDQKKVGHAGTLDPLASGLLVLGLGRATRLLRYVQDLPKEYSAVAQLGVATDTLDSEGEVIERRPMNVSEDDVRSAMRGFIGETLQVPPMHSALKVGGRRLHRMARAGIEVEREARPITIHGMELAGWDDSPYPKIDFRVTCSKGTYVRVLADDLARALGGRAHLLSLRRLRSGSLSVDEAIGLDELGPTAALLSPAAGLRDLPATSVPVAVRHRVIHGAPVARSMLGGDLSDGPIGMLDEDGGLLAVYRAAPGDSVLPEVVLS